MAGKLELKTASAQQPVRVIVCLDQTFVEPDDDEETEQDERAFSIAT